MVDFQTKLWILFGRILKTIKCILKGCLVGHIKKKSKDVTNIQISVLFFIIVIIYFLAMQLVES